MARVNLKSAPTIGFSMGTFVLAIVYAYALSYPPFIFESYLPVPARIAIEGFTLFLLLLVVLRYEYGIKELVWFLLYFATVSITLSLGMDLFVKTVSSFNKIIFVILLLALLRANRRMLGKCLAIWTGLWSVLGVMAILAFIGYLSRIIHFSPVDFSESLGGPPGSYYYLNNPLLGNLIPRTLFGISFGRVAGIMYEGGMLGYFFGFNILVANDWIQDRSRARNFIWLNLIAGITTLSLTFLFFMIGYFLSKRIVDSNRGKLSARTVFLLPFFVLLILLTPFLVLLLLEQSSGSVRLVTFSVYLQIIENNTWLSWLLGNGVGISETWGVGGIDSGWLAILIERGGIMLSLIVYFFVVHTKHNRWLTSYVLFYNCAFYLFWDPIFLLGIAIHYACFSPSHKSSAAVSSIAAPVASS